MPAHLIARFQQQKKDKITALELEVKLVLATERAQVIAAEKVQKAKKCQPDGKGNKFVHQAEPYYCKGLILYRPDFLKEWGKSRSLED